MNDNILVSLIVAVYNGEKYIASCIDSIMNQTYKNYEVILVDDGSKDSSGTICDHYAEKDSRIKVIHQVNRGCSAARNEGLSHAKGEYIGIIDQDDYLHEKYIEYFMKLMLDHNAEIATTDTILSFIGDAPVSTDLDFNKYNVISGEDAAKEMLMYTLQIGPWNKLIKKSLIEREGISFHEQFYCGEGFAFSVECFQSTNKVVVGHQNVYFYRIDNATIGSSTFSLGKYKSSVNAQDYMRNVLKDKSQYADNVLKFSKWRTLSDNFTLLKASGDEDRYPEIYHELKIEVKKGALGALKIPVKPKQKIRAFAFWISPEMAAYVFSSYLNHKMGGKFQRNMNISGGAENKLSQELRGILCSERYFILTKNYTSYGKMTSRQYNVLTTTNPTIEKFVCVN